MAQDADSPRRRFHFLLKLLPPLLLVLALGWCTSTNRVRLEQNQLQTELRELFQEQGVIGNSSTNLETVARELGEPGMNRLFYAVAGSASLPALRWLVSHGADPKHITPLDGRVTLMQQFAKGMRYDKLEFLLGQGMDVQERTREGSTLLHLAAQGSLDERSLALLTAKGLAIDARNSDGRQPIHFASPRSLPVLLAAGADIDAQDQDGRTPLHLAAFEGRADAVALLLQRQASQFTRDRQGRTPLHLAALKQCEACIDALIAAGAVLADRDNEGRTARDLAQSAQSENKRWRTTLDKLDGR